LLGRDLLVGLGGGGEGRQGAAGGLHVAGGVGWVFCW
jgi:hypothetical protein